VGEDVVADADATAEVAAAGRTEGQADRRTDGRLSRSERTRAAVVDALLVLLERGNLRPTGREIAEEAGVSLRSVYVHFDDVESLFCEAALRHHERMEALFTPWHVTGSLDERLDALVDRRRAIFEEGAHVRRAAVLQEPFSPVLRRVLDVGRHALRAEIEGVFAAELGMVPDGERPRLRAALEIATSPDTWDVLRANQDLSPDEAAALVRDTVRATLAGWGRGGQYTSGDPPPTT
jgi:TetR/AcrR family transcriptional regulator, regulator of autoinduction and epiphytic fitness